MKPALMLNSKNATSDWTELTYSEAMDLALYALAPRARSRAELHEHLLKRNAAEELAEADQETHDSIVSILPYLERKKGL